MRNFKCGKCGSEWEDYTIISNCPDCGGVGEIDDIPSPSPICHPIINGLTNKTPKKKFRYPISSLVFKNKKKQRRK